MGRVGLLLVAGFLLTLGGCKKDCANNDDFCARKGHCTEVDGHCRAGSDAECESAEHCKTQGKCAKTEEGWCAPSSATHCLLSEGCKRDTNKECVFMPKGTGPAPNRGGAYCTSQYEVDRWREQQGSDSD